MTYGIKPLEYIGLFFLVFIVMSLIFIISDMVHDNDTERALISCFVVSVCVITAFAYLCLNLKRQSDYYKERLSSYEDVSEED